MPSLQDALRLNNEAVSLLLRNEDRKAVECLSKSLVLMKRLLVSPTTSPASASSPNEGAGSSRCLVLHDTTHPLPNFQQEEVSHSFVYTRAISFSGESEDLFTEDNAHLYSAVIILNIALAYHRQGKRSCLDKAERMYEMASKLVNDAAINQGTSLLIHLAALNNLAQLRYDRGEFKSSQESFRLLARLIGSSASSEQHVVETSEVRGMLLNVLSATTLPVVAAAA